MSKGIYSTLGRHSCLKNQVRCEIQQQETVYDHIENHYENVWVTLSVGSNSCISSLGPGACAREGLESGEQYELCGPPLHAEEDALNSLNPLSLRKGHRLRAVVSGHNYICNNCLNLLESADINEVVMMMPFHAESYKAEQLQGRDDV